VVLETGVETTSDWGMLGYWIGDQVQDRVPVVEGVKSIPNLARLKHFGAAASSSGGVEMYHLVGITPEAPSVEAAFGGNRSIGTLRFGAAEHRATWEKINATGKDTKVDYVMLGCATRWIALGGRAPDRRPQGAPHCELWIFGTRDRQSPTRTARRRFSRTGARLMTDSCWR
jgi:predicted aconitase